MTTPLNLKQAAPSGTTWWCRAFLVVCFHVKGNLVKPMSRLSPAVETGVQPEARGRNVVTLCR